ncbi:MAG: M48 family metallopeptidase [Microbacteriaceae bacterium]|nr:M48 family metallopeptidase [Microbacteriaceae bacterium]
MYSEISRNKRNTFLIMLFFVLLLGGLGWLVGSVYNNYKITIVIVVGALLYATFQYFMAARQAVFMSGGIEIDREDHPRLYNIVENLAITTGMPMPRVYIVIDPAPNAFATGRNPKKAIVAATTGILDLLNDNELEGVMAHEMGHVRNYDIRLNMIVYGLVVAIGIIADLCLRLMYWSHNNRGVNKLALIFTVIAMLVAPLVATIVQLAISRQREYLADATGALTTRYPDALASALHKLETNAQPLRKQHASMAHMWIADPKAPGFIQTLFSTHPPTSERVRRLLAMGDKF